MMLSMGIGRFVYTPILPIMVEDLGLDAAQAGMIASSNFLGHLVGALIAATPWLGGSQRLWLIAMMFASAFTTGLMGITDSYTGFLLVRFIGGVVGSMILVFASNLVIERLIRSGRSELTAVHFGGVGLGIAFSALLVAIGGSVGEAWRTAWWISGVVSAVLAVLVATQVPPDLTPSRKFTTTGSHRNNRIAGIAVGYGLFGFGYVITATFLIQLVRSGEFSTQTETIIWVLVGLAGAPSVYCWNRIASRIGNTMTFSIACVVEAVGVGASVIAGSMVSLVIAAVFLGGTFMGITALGLVEARQRTNLDPRATLALMTAAFGVGQITGPTVAGYLRDTTGSFVLPSVLAMIALGIAAVSVHHGSRR